ncbi:hypothetical protein vBAmePPT11V19_00030 [Alteromonas phage vB_AmeP_PT11-V19]|nr:hypothetical protein vBAmePPT11V19_00030 [Alteromonas phage vB_AmeP_PT11-V19]
MSGFSNSLMFKENGKYVQLEINFELFEFKKTQVKEGVLFEYRKEKNLITSTSINIDHVVSVTKVGVGLGIGNIIPCFAVELSTGEIFYSEKDIFRVVALYCKTK